MEAKIKWLKNWFYQRTEKNEFPDGIETKNYFEAGLIDSFGIIELIEDIESEFNINFQENNFQDRRFSTIQGLAEIIEELKLAQGEEK